MLEKAQWENSLMFDSDFLGWRSFGSMLDIIPLADSVTKLTAQCEQCGKRAYFTLRKTEETQTELIGGAEVYMPVCRQHYVSEQGVVEAARVVLQQKLQCGRASAMALWMPFSQLEKVYYSMKVFTGKRKIFGHGHHVIRPSPRRKAYLSLC
ncbi:hypothetical protein Ancab_033380 [Ancistrocladus abbreviatus]